MLEAISGILSIVHVTSLSAYIFLSAGVKFPDWLIKLIPISFTWFINSSLEIFILYPSIDSNLSAVPPSKS